MISKVKDASAHLIQQYQKIDVTRNEAEKPVGAANAGGEKVSFSKKAKEIQQIKKIVDETPDVRNDKIVELKAQIAGGNYNIPSGKIADRIMGETLTDLFSK